MGQQFVVVNAMDNSYLFHAVASFLIVNHNNSEEDIKKHLANDVDAREEANTGHSDCCNSSECKFSDFNNFIVRT
jgi:hypothetical protein